MLVLTQEMLGHKMRPGRWRLQEEPEYAWPFNYSVHGRKTGGKDTELCQDNRLYKGTP